MAKPKPLMTKSSGTDPHPANAAVQSALRTLETESSGVTAIAAALEGPLGPAFAAATDLIRNAKGRVIVTGLGKSGHVARKIVANVTHPLTVEGRTLTLTTSIGIAVRSEIRTADAATAEALIGRADAALYAAKKAGRNTWRVVADDVLIETMGTA